MLSGKVSIVIESLHCSVKLIWVDLKPIFSQKQFTPKNPSALNTVNLKPIIKIHIRSHAIDFSPYSLKNLTDWITCRSPNVSKNVKLMNVILFMDKKICEILMMYFSYEFISFFSKIN